MRRFQKLISVGCPENILYLSILHTFPYIPLHRRRYIFGLTRSHLKQEVDNSAKLNHFSLKRQTRGKLSTSFFNGCSNGTGDQEKMAEENQFLLFFSIFTELGIKIASVFTDQGQISTEKQRQLIQNSALSSETENIILRFNIAEKTEHEYSIWYTF